MRARTNARMQACTRIYDIVSGATVPYVLSHVGCVSTNCSSDAVCTMTFPCLYISLDMTLSMRLYRTSSRCGR